MEIIFHHSLLIIISSLIRNLWQAAQMLVYWWWEYQLSLVQINRGFWFMSRETGHLLGPGGYVIYRHSILINVSSVYPGHLTGSCLQDGCSLHNPGSTEGEVWPRRLKSLHYHWEFHNGNCPWVQIFLFQFVQDWVHSIQYSGQDKANTAKFASQGLDLCWRC